MDLLSLGNPARSPLLFLGALGLALLSCRGPGAGLLPLGLDGLLLLLLLLLQGFVGLAPKVGFQPVASIWEASQQERGVGTEGLRDMKMRLDGRVPLETGVEESKTEDGVPLGDWLGSRPCLFFLCWSLAIFLASFLAALDGCLWA